MEARRCAKKHTSKRARERGVVSRNLSHTEARVLRTASAVIKLCPSTQ